MKRTIIATVLGAMSIIVSAQSLPTITLPKSLGFINDIFSPRPAALTKLLDEKKVVEADSYLRQEGKYFLIDSKTEQADLVRRASSEINAFFDPFLVSSIESLALIPSMGGAESWGRQKEILRIAENTEREYGALLISTIDKLKSDRYLELQKNIGLIRATLAAKSAIEFASFNHAGEGNFFDLYPVNVPIDFFTINREYLIVYVSQLNSAQVVQLRKKYETVISGSKEFDSQLLARYFDVALPVVPSPTLRKILSAVELARGAGFSVAKIPNARIGFIEVTSKTLLSEGQIEFPSQIEMDIPFEATKAEIDSVLDASNKLGANIVIVLDVAASRNSRRVIAKTDFESKYVSAIRTDPNPAYETARSKLYEAQSGLANAQSQRTVGVAAAILNGIAVALWSKNVGDAQAALSSTPTTIKSNEYRGYNYSTSEVATTRTLTANYYVIDQQSGKYFKGTFDAVENKSFRIAYGLNDKDPEKGSILTRHVSESDIVSYEQSPVQIKISQLINDYLRNESQSVALQSVAALRSEILRDKNTALTAYKSTQYSAKAANDSRFDSVVVVLNPTGKSGTGFFVAPDLILTNYHVVEGAQFLEMKLYNGLETFGKVVKTDVRLDLALVRVQTRGVPAKIFSENNLELGATVEAIGHPKGLTFTITRGIVSAVRKRPSVFAVGGKEVLFVQTDAAINPGNSGGPLFLGGSVIGVNNNKLVAGSEGLGFSVHYSEVSEFLKGSF